MEVACSADARQAASIAWQRGICYTVLLRCAAAAAAQFPPSKQRTLQPRLLEASSRRRPSESDDVRAPGSDSYRSVQYDYENTASN